MHQTAKLQDSSVTAVQPALSENLQSFRSQWNQDLVVRIVGGHDGKTPSLSPYDNPLGSRLQYDSEDEVQAIVAMHAACQKSKDICRKQQDLSLSPYNNLLAGRLQYGDEDDQVRGIQTKISPLCNRSTA